MNSVYECILEKYGYDEPVFIKELKQYINLPDGTLRQNLKRLSDKGALMKVQDGIYYVQKADGILQKPRVNIDKVIRRKYIQSKDQNIVGYLSGINFANQLGLTSQTASLTTIVTNATGRPEHKVMFDKKVVKLKKPRVKINNQNYKLLQILDLLNSLDQLSEISLESSISLINNYLKDANIAVRDLKPYIKFYPRKTLENLLEMELYNESA